MRLPARPFRHVLIAASLALLGGRVADAATWSQLQPSAHARSEGTFIVHDGGAFHFNGFSANLGIENTIERYDIATDTWQTVAETTDSPGFPTALTHSGVVVIDGRVWLMGGRIGAHPGTVTDRVFIFDLETYGWDAGPTLPVPFAGGGAALVDGRIHLFGGLDAQARCDVTTHLVYDLDDPANGWQDLSASAPFPNPRNHFGTVVKDGLIYAIGGQIGHDNCNSLAQQRVQTKLVHVYDPATNDWDRLADMPWPQSHAEPSTFTHAGLIWSVGGMVQGDRVLSYDPASDAWTWRNDLDLPNALLAPGARIFHGNRLHVFGGGAPNVFNPRTETWVTDVPGLAHDGGGGEPDPGMQDDDPVDPTPPGDDDAPADDAAADDGDAQEDPTTAGDDTSAGDGDAGNGIGNPLAVIDDPVVQEVDADTADAPADKDVPETTSDDEIVDASGGGGSAGWMLLLALGIGTRMRRSSVVSASKAT